MVESVSANHLEILKISEPGFVTGATSLQLLVNENSPSGTVIGSVAAADPDQETLINAIVSSSTDIYHSAETGYFYQIIHTPELHSDAVANAQTIPLNGVYGQLISINSATENAVVVAIMNDAGISQTHLNATDSVAEGDWRWSDSDELFWKNSSESNIPVNGAYSNWNGTNPNDVNGQDMAKIFASNGEWDDVKET